MTLEPYVYRIQVERVIDGDTVFATIQLGFNIRCKEYIRLHGVNTPEIYGATATPAGTLAREFVNAWLSMAKLLTLHSRKYNEREKYGRVLGTIYRDDDPESLNAALIREGHAVAIA